jgi:membrane-associated phospholipid phosphatase
MARSASTAQATGWEARLPSGAEIRWPGPQARRAEIAGPAVAAMVLVVCLSRDGVLRRIDQALVSVAAQRRGTATVRMAELISALAEPEVAAIALSAASAVAAPRVGQRAFGPGVTVLAGMAVRRGLSIVIGRERPPADMWLVEPEGFSMPSKHTSLAALTAGACALTITGDRRAAQAAALLAATAVGASRVCLGIHWPSDVLAGWLFAAGWLELGRSAAPPPAPPGTAPSGTVRL